MPQPRRLNHAAGPLVLDAALGDVAVLLSGDVTALSVASLEGAASFRAVFIQDAGGGHDITWPAWTYADGPPEIDPAPGAITATVIADLAGGPRAWVTDFGSLEIAAAVLIADDPWAPDAGTIGLIETRLSKSANLSDVVDAAAARTNLAAAPLASPAFTGNPTAPTPSAADNDTSVATTAFVQGAIAPLATKAANLSDIENPATARTNIGAAPLASPAFTGNPTAPTPTAGDSDTSIATTAFVQGAIAPLATKAANLSDIADVTTARANLGAAPLASPAFTGNPTGPTPALGDNDTSLATTAFVQLATSEALMSVPRPNYIDNASFNVWQAGTNFTLPAATNVFLADRWKGRHQSGAASVSRQAGFSGSIYCLRAGRDPGASGTTYIAIYQQVESQLAVSLQGKTIYVSFSARKGADYSASNSYLNVVLISGTGTDEAANLNTGAFPTGSVAAPAENIQITTSAQRFSLSPVAIPSNATELILRIGYPPSGTAGGADYFEITNVKLETGSTTLFEPAPPADELRRCLRHYEKSFAVGTAPGQGGGTNSGEEARPAPASGATAQRLGTVSFKERKRTTATVTLFNPAAANSQLRDETASADCTSAVVSSITDRGFRVGCTGNSATAIGNDLCFHWVADARL